MIVMEDKKINLYKRILSVSLNKDTYDFLKKQGNKSSYIDSILRKEMFKEQQKKDNSFKIGI